MKAITPHRFGYRIQVLAAAIALTSSSVCAAPGTLADAPLFMTTSVQPNVLFLVDDSGSMDWEVQLSNGALLAHPGNRNSGDLTYAPTNDWNRLELCAGYNVLAYNPAVSYTAWKGRDSAGNLYPESMSFTAARNNPYNPTGTTDLTNQFYFVWNDADADGQYDAGECPTPAVTNATDCAGFAGQCVRVSTLTTAQKTNYANWFSYYRKREYVAKRAVTELVSASSSRMGLATLHNNSIDGLGVRTPVADVDDLTTPINTTAQANKVTLLRNVARIDSSSGTPLRQTLEAAGNYFDQGTSSTWGASPILSAGLGGSCQQNFTILMSDGYWNGSDPSVGNTDTDGAGIFDGGSFADTYSNTLADVAMHYYETDLATGLTDNVPVTSVDPQSLDRMHQHMVTFTAAFGVNGTLTANPLNQTDAFTWPEPIQNTATTIDDMRHAAWNGRGQFLNAGDPSSLINGLEAVLADISGRTSTASAVAFNTGSLSTESEVYLALFNSYRWSGDLHSYSLNPVTGAVSGTPTWTAASHLDNRDLSSDARTILTFNPTTRDGAPLQWASLTATQQADLRTNSVGGTDNEATGLARMRYIRGDRVCENGYDPASNSLPPRNFGGPRIVVGESSVSTCDYTVGATNYTLPNFRVRDSRFGDIIHSAPVYVGKPNSGWPDTVPGTTPYTNFRASNNSRAGVIYTGANDGMLHAFAESSGREIMAYAPNLVFSTAGGQGLHTLSEPGYSHKYYVDLTPTVVDAYVKTSVAGTVGWKTILVGGLRGGGRGLFALDVTSPSFSESGTAPQDTVMWEFTNANDADLGYTYSEPAIVPMNNGKWAAVFGNGYNDTGSGQAKLFIVYLEEGLDGTWSATDYKKLSTNSGDTTNRNGLGSPTVIDLNGDGVADRIYAGDLRGQMWAFDVSASNSNSWGSAYGNTTTPRPLFTAPANQQITSRPRVVLNPVQPSSNANAPNRIVLFGTGQYLVNADKSTTYQQAFYGVWDAGTGNLNQSNLISQTVGTGTTAGGFTGRTLTDDPIDYGASDKGWYINLPTSRERVITTPVVRGDLVFFSTTIPDSDPCNTAAGSGWLMVAKFVNGGRPDEAAFDLNNDGRVDNLDEIADAGAAGERVEGLPSAPVNLGNQRYTTTTETVDGSSIRRDTLVDLEDQRTGRLSWEELVRP